MIKLNDDNVYVGQIKQILSGFELPQCRVLKSVDPNLDEIYICGGGVYSKDVFLRGYKLGDRIDNVTKRMRLDSMVYDEHTHRYLGEYLRFIRDYTGVDMMSMYNCFSYFKPNIVYYEVEKDDSTSFEINANDDRYDVFSVPVLFDRNYVLAMDWHGEVSYAFGYHSYGDEVGIMPETISKVSGLRFDSPINVKSPASEDTSREKSLRLFIKIPKACESEIVMLEGEYGSLQLILDEFNERLGDEFLEYIPQDETDVDGEVNANYDFVTKHQLLNVNTRDRNLLSDRMIEYLSNGVISPNDPVVKNVKRLQKTMHDKDLLTGKFDYGVWDDDMRKSLYAYIRKSGLCDSEFDLLSYCDKDVERSLGYLKELVDKNGKLLYE